MKTLLFATSDFIDYEFDRYDYSFSGIVCPLCGKINEVIQEDYTDRPMIWCNDFYMEPSQKK
jgi:hypothetical protein